MSGAEYWSLHASTRRLFPPEKGPLSIQGEHFYTDDGALWQCRGVSLFLLFLLYCRGLDITPQLRWMHHFGMNLPRIFCALPWNETPDYRWESFRFDLVDPFLDLLESSGLRSNWSIGHYRHPRLAEYAQRLYDTFKGRWSVLTEHVNEPHVGEKPDPIDDFAGVDHHGVLTSYGLYSEFYDQQEGLPPVKDFGTIHTPRGSAWARQARHVQEIQHKTRTPWLGDEPAKIVEPGFIYPGGKNDPVRTPMDAVWHFGVLHLWTAGGTFHCEQGKWGLVPEPGMLQYTVAEAVRDQVWKRIDATWQIGAYTGSHMKTISPVDHIPYVWSYSTRQEHRALAVRCKAIEPEARNGWTIVETWGPGHSLVKLER